MRTTVPPYFVIDIETIPDQSIPEEDIPKFDKVFNEMDVKTGNTKDLFLIREKVEAARAKFEKERIEFEESVIKKMSTDPDLCQVCCLVAFDAGGFTTDFAKDRDSEYELLDHAWSLIRAKLQDHVMMVTFNGLTFDLPVLYRRAMIQDVSVGPAIFEALTAKYSNRAHLDLMQALGGRNPFSGKMEFKGLDHYLKRFCLGAKMADWDGSKVYPAFKEGRFEEIVQYCKSDVLNTAALFERVAPWLLLPKAETETETAITKGK